MGYRPADRRQRRPAIVGCASTAENRCDSIQNRPSLDRPSLYASGVSAARIKPFVVQVESHPYLCGWELLGFCREHGIVLQAFATVGHGLEPKVIEDSMITAIAQRVHKTPAQVVLAWAVQRGTAFLTTSTKPERIRENFEISALPEDAMREIRERITANVSFNIVVQAGVPWIYSPGAVS
jgi:diketogulonate reductase-like aldo/keto reductase